MLSLTTPHAAAHVLKWRQSTLPLAIGRAAHLGLRVAACPWRTISGQECSGYWPAGTAAFHVNADIAIAAVHYMDATGDEGFSRDTGMELLVTPPGCGTPSASTMPMAGSASTGSPDPTSTAPWPTTTSIRT
jgi:trehalose/maltose hydrolase-like predicted phosphorylase